MTALYAIVRRELAAYFFAPIAYVVGVLFLILQGLSFWAVIEVLSDPRRPAGYGAVLATHFGGTPLYWAVLFAVIAVVSMRLCAEEKRSGTWEALLSAPVSEATVIAGKWLAACAFYAALWLPTLSYVVLLNLFAPAEGGVDLGPILSAYAGVLAYGGAFLAIGLAASAATSNQIIAAAATFSLSWGLLLVGQIPDLAATSGEVPTGLALLDLRAHMESLATGEVTLASIAMPAAIAAVALAVAHRLAVGDRRPPRERRRRSVALGLVAVNAGLALALVARHPISWDVTASRRHTLEPRTREVLGAIDRPLQLVIVRPTASKFEPVWREVDRLVARFERAQPLISRRDVDPALEPAAIEQISREFALAPGDVAEGGTIVLQLGLRRRAVQLLDMAGFSYDDLGAGALSQFRAEEALASSIAELAEREPLTVCASTGHGEMPLSPTAGGPDWSSLGDRLRRDGIAIENVGRLSDGVPNLCRALIVAGPTHPLSAAEALAVDRYLGAGGRLLLAADARPEPGQSAAPPTGLELVISQRGISLSTAVVVDPENEIELPLAWKTDDGYGDHAIAAGFQGRRVTVWPWPRMITGGQPFVTGSLTSWAETDLAALFTGQDVAAGDQERASRPPIAAAAVEEATGARIVVLGSALAASSAIAGRGLGSADALTASAVAWLTERSRSIAVGDKMPEHVRLVMTKAQLQGTFAFCVVALPGLFALLGGAIAWRRRRG